MKTRLYSIVKFAVGWPLSLLAFFFIGKIIYDQAPTLVPHIQTITPLLLFYGVLSFVIFYFLRSFIWYRIVKGFGYTISFKESCYLWSISELKRYIPGNVWSFLGRAVLFHKKGVEKKDIGKGLIIEAEVFVIGSIIVSLLSLPFLLPGFNATIGWLAVITVFLGVAVYSYNRKLFSRIHFLFPPFAPKETLLLITISIVALLFFGLGNYFVISAAFLLDPQLLPQLIGIFVLAFVAGYLSIITPAGLGVREGIMIFALNKIISTGVAAFAALFSRLILIISEVLFIALSFLWFKLHSPLLKKIESWIAAHLHEAVVLSLALIYTIYFSTISMLRYDHFYAGRFDLGNMAQTVWNTSTGNFFMLTDPNGTAEVSRLAFHADFMLILLAPFYWIWPDPRMLLLIQTIVVAIGAYFVYLITKKVLNQKLLGVVFAFAYLINPSVQRVNIYDFHASALATTFLLATFYFYLRKQYVWFIVFAVLAAFCKEQIWAIIALFGVFLMVHHRKWLFGGIVFLVSVSTFYFLVSYAIPQSLGSDHFALKYYAEFGNSPAEVIRTFILSPDKVIGLLMEDEHIKYLRQLFSPLGYLSLLAPWMLMFAVPDLMINLMSSNPQLHYIYYQYTAAITPFVFIAAIYGIWMIKKFEARISKSETNLNDRKRNDKNVSNLNTTVNILLVFYILYFSLTAAYNYGPLPGSREPNIAMMTKPEKNRELIDETIVSIPQDAKVAASNNIGSHFSNHRFIYVLPYGIDQADYIVFLISPTQTSWSISDEEQLVNKLREDPKYSIVVQKDGFTVFKKK